MILIEAALVLAAGITPIQQQDPAPLVRRIAATVELAAQEYGVGVQGGVVVSEPEIAEARLFLAEARNAAAGLPAPEADATASAIDSLLAAVDRLADPGQVADSAGVLGQRLAAELGVALSEIPEHRPQLSLGVELYSARCASCHGADGRGDGPQSAGLDPPPADLTDFAALSDQSPLDAYRRVTYGVAGTAMPAFEELTFEERWAVSRYASTLRLPSARGEVPALLQNFEFTARRGDAELIELLRPTHGGDAAAVLAAVRRLEATNDRTLAATATLAMVRFQVDSALALAGAARVSEAQSAALAAYMTFESVERQLRTRAPGLSAELEGRFASFRAKLAGDEASVAPVHAELADGLSRAGLMLTGSMGGAEVFAKSFVILLREGVEAILIIGALLTFLVKLGAADRRRDVYRGVAAALFASALTAVAIETIFQLSPAGQETLEGVTMLLAAVVLFYVSYWLLSRMEVARWNRFVRSKVAQALSGGSALALPAVAFLAVYREGFETVLFYKALFVEAGDGAAVPVIGGILLGSLALAAIYLAISRYGLRLPLKAFFGVSGVLLYLMAVIFAGKGVLELQAGGALGATPLSWVPTAPALGLYPTLEGFLAQATLVSLFGLAMIWTLVSGRGERRALAAESLAAEQGPSSEGAAA